MLWFRISDHLATLSIATFIAYACWGLYDSVPRWALAWESFDETTVLAELPVGWPIDDMTLPPGTRRAYLPSEYWRLTPEYVIDGRRWEDPEHYGKYPVRYAVAFSTEESYASVFTHLLNCTQAPFYRVTYSLRTREVTKFKLAFCDGDTIVHFIGPGPYSMDNLYVVEVLLYDH